MAGQRAKRTSDRAERAARNLSGFAVLYRSPGSLPDVFLKPRSQVRSLLGAPSPRPRRTAKAPAASVASRAQGVGTARSLWRPNDSTPAFGATVRPQTARGLVEHGQVDERALLRVGLPKLVC